MIQKGALKTPKTCSTDRFTQLSLMRVIACVGIIVLHTVFAANEYFAANVTPNENLVSRMVENNMMWAVPAFVMVTGVLQLNPDKQLTLRKLYGKYILRILIALVCCCIVFRIFDMIMDGEPLTAAGVLQAFVELVTAKCWGHLWYLYLLIGLYVLLPFYRMVMERASEKELRYLCLVYLVFVSIIPMIESFGIHIGFYISESIIYPLYLLLGYMIFYKMIRISSKMGVALIALSTLIIIGMDAMRFSYSQRSNHWYLLRRSSNAGGNMSFSSNIKGMMILSRLLAALISSGTKVEPLMALVHTNTNTGHSQIPFMIPSSYILPAGMSRGAIQHLKPAASRLLQRSLAIPLSSDE